jgi:hypothetical protein
MGTLINSQNALEMGFSWVIMDENESCNEGILK